MLDMGFSKKERKTLLHKVELIEKEFQLLKEADAQKLCLELKGLKSSIVNFLPNEEKAVAQARKETSRHKNVAKDASEEVLKIKDQLVALQTSLSETLDEGKTSNGELKNLLTNFNSIKESVDSKVLQIDSALEGVRNKVNESNSLLENANELKEKVGEFEELVNSSIDQEKKISTIHTRTNKIHSELKTAHDEIYGYDDEDEEGKTVHIDGLKDELEKSFEGVDGKLKTYEESLDQFKQNKESEYLEVKKQWNGQFEETDKKLKSLLPGAMTAGLSYAYKDKKEEEIEERKEHKKVYYKAIMAMVVISLIPLVIEMYLLISGAKSIDDILKLTPYMLLFVLPLYVPPLWVALGASKKIKLSKRLIEEYAHKEATSKTFEGLSNQVKEMEEDGISKELSEKLLRNLITISAENPGKLISDYHSSDHPIQDILNKSDVLTNSIDKVTNSMDFKKLIGVMNLKTTNSQSEDRKFDDDNQSSTNVHS